MAPRSRSNRNTATTVPAVFSDSTSETPATEAAEPTSTPSTPTENPVMANDWDAIAASVQSASAEAFKPVPPAVPESIVALIKRSLTEGGLSANLTIPATDNPEADTKLQKEKTAAFSRLLRAAAEKVTHPDGGGGVSVTIKVDGGMVLFKAGKRRGGGANKPVSAPPTTPTTAESASEAQATTPAAA